MGQLESHEDAPQSGSIEATHAHVERVLQLVGMFSMALQRRCIEQGVSEGAEQMTPEIVDRAVQQATEDLLTQIEQ